MTPISNQIHSPVRARIQKPFNNYWRRIFPQYMFGIKKKNSVCPGEIAPSTQLGNSHHVCSLAPWKQVLKIMHLESVRRSSSSDLLFCKIQLLPEIQLVKSADIKSPARASLSPYFEMQQNRRKYWLQLRHSPGTKDLQL